MNKIVVILRWHRHYYFSPRHLLVHLQDRDTHKTRPPLRRWRRHDDKHSVVSLPVNGMIKLIFLKSPLLLVHLFGFNFEFCEGTHPFHTYFYMVFLYTVNDLNNFLVLPFRYRQPCRHFFLFMLLLFPWTRHHINKYNLSSFTSCLNKNINTYFWMINPFKFNLLLIICLYLNLNIILTKIRPIYSFGVWLHSVLKVYGLLETLHLL